MTDYLEELLNRQEDENEEFVPLKPVFRSVQTTQLHSEQPEASFPNMKHANVQTADMIETAVLPQQVLDPKRRVNPVSLLARQTVPAAVFSPEQDLSAPAPRVATEPIQFLWDRVRHTYSAARLWQTRTLHPGGSAGGAAGSTTPLPLSPDKQRHFFPSTAAQVDAAFARDARRYDGPLRLL